MTAVLTQRIPLPSETIHMESAWLLNRPVWESSGFFATLLLEQTVKQSK